ncbi:lamin tail domain-containing protein [Flavisolibacter tropicus]|uniref:lamin tail domain-containing protein n=1 Tax=Flavisolibacter tropicus TaxID=1492898 RepID=UPI0008343FC1|nr:lamin tail domain-containing protein [Flavisolibacter tropicus]
MRTILVCLLALLPVSRLFAQVKDDFSDGDLSINPTWLGTLTNWKINTTGQLQSNNTTANSSYFLSTINELATDAQWEFTLRLQFNTSSANYIDVFLIASAEDLSANTTTGYFVRIGNTQDEVALYRKDGSSSTKIIDGVDGITNTSDNTLRIKVLRTAGVFVLYRDASGTGSTFTEEGVAADNTYTTSTHFGISVKQSTSSFFQKHYFDDISIVPYTPDVTPPAIASLIALSPTNIDVLFSEPVERSSSETLTNYNVNSLGIPTTSKLDFDNLALVHLAFATPLTNGTTYTLTINGIKDIAGNTLNRGTGTFSHYTPQRFDVIIDEIMADPTPPIDLPNVEYIELKNISGRSLNLEGWRLYTLTSTSGSFPSYTLPADSFLVVTTTSGAALFPKYLRVLGVSSFPSLANDGTTLSLRSKNQTLIHAVAYEKAWYGEEKEEGGWSLEMIDPQNPCTSAANWKASTHSSGGTPGQKNAVHGLNSDNTPPVLLQVYPIGTDTLVLRFNEPLDSASAATMVNYTISGNTVTGIKLEAPLFQTVYLKLGAPLKANTTYTIKSTNIKDCKGNAGESTVITGIPEAAAALDIVINEILFNPAPNGDDYVELYNNSNKLIDAKDLFIANRNSTGAIASKKQLTTNSFFIAPGAYVVVTENKAGLSLRYHVKQPEAVLELSTLPSFPDDKGTVVLLNQAGTVLDEVIYNSSWHFDLIANPEGVSLERLDPKGVSQEANNWHSAASTAGYGTPTYKNSQYKQVEEGHTLINITPKVFSPDNDGYDDIAFIQYQAIEPGWVANITLFDVRGVPVRYLVKNGTMGLKGNWIWDGLNEQHQKLPVGTYIVLIELFNLEGKRERFKETVVLARKV